MGTELKNNADALIMAEKSLGLKYSAFICSCTSGDIRAKLLFGQRGVNEAAENMLDEAASRGWIGGIKADSNVIDKVRRGISAK